MGYIDLSFDGDGEARVLFGHPEHSRIILAPIDGGVEIDCSHGWFDVLSEQLPEDVASIIKDTLDLFEGGVWVEDSEIA